MSSNKSLAAEFQSEIHLSVQSEHHDPRPITSYVKTTVRSCLLLCAPGLSSWHGVACGSTHATDKSMRLTPTTRARYSSHHSTYRKQQRHHPLTRGHVTGHRGAKHTDNHEKISPRASGPAKCSSGFPSSGASAPASVASPGPPHSHPAPPAPTAPVPVRP